MEWSGQEWGFRVNIKDKVSELYIPVQDEYTADEIVAVILETVNFLSTLYSVLRAEESGGIVPGSKSFMN